MVGGGGGCGIDPSGLHLKKELSQIRKGSRLPRDLATSSSWRSPISSATSLTKHHYVHHYKNGHTDGNAIPGSSVQYSQIPFQVRRNSKCGDCNNSVSSCNVNAKERQRKVPLHNWRSHKSDNGKDGDAENENDAGSYSSHEESNDSDGLRNNHVGDDSTSYSCVNNGYDMSFFKCKDTSFIPSIRHSTKKSKRSNRSSTSLHRSHKKLQKQMVLNRLVKNTAENLTDEDTERDDLATFVDHSDDTEDECYSFLARSPAKLWKFHRKEEDSASQSTPALSMSSYNDYGFRDSALIPCDLATGSLNDAADEADDQLDCPVRQRCGIPCYWSKSLPPKSRVGHWSSYSPSLNTTLRRKGSSIFCGSQTSKQRRWHRSSMVSNKRRLVTQTKANNTLSFLTNSGHHQGGSSIGNDCSDQEFSSNFVEHDLEASIRLAGKRRSSCRSRDGFKLVATTGNIRGEGSPQDVINLCHKYRPMVFKELIGQNVAVQSLSSAISRGRISPIYLFQGPHGTGKTSSARIFAAALNCLVRKDTKPCGVCRECVDLISGKTSYLIEVDGSDKKGIETIKNHLRNLSVEPQPTLSKYKVFVVDECHLLPSKSRMLLPRLLEDLPRHVIFILITTDIDNVHNTILSRCQKIVFNKVSSCDIIARLRKISDDENLYVESDALDLIASNADGSPRDAETILDQLTQFGKGITTSLVNKFIGAVPDERLLNLLELAMTSNATETVKMARELMNSGHDPVVLTSRMATLIVDIIAGTFLSADSKNNNSFFVGRILSDRELDGLKHVLTILSESEKHLRVSTERSTWFTATLLQLGSVPNSGSSRRQSFKTTEEDRRKMLGGSSAEKQKTDAESVPENSGSEVSITAHQSIMRKDDPLVDDVNDNCNPNQLINAEALALSHYDYGIPKTALTYMNSKVLTSIWVLCIEKCHSETLRKLLRSHGKLVCISEVKGGFVAYVAFWDSAIKTRAEGFLSSIANLFKVVLQYNVEVEIILLPDSLGQKQIMKEVSTNPKNKPTRSNRRESISGLELEPLRLVQVNYNNGEVNQTRPFESFPGNDEASTSRESEQFIPLRRIESIIREQRLETAWLQATGRGISGSSARPKAETDDDLPRDGLFHRDHLDLLNSENLLSQDEFNCDITALKINDEMESQDHRTIKRNNQYLISPSLLHNSSFASDFYKEHIGYKSGSQNAGCSGLFCWNSDQPLRRGKDAHARRMRRFSWFGICAKMEDRKRIQQIT